ncbi:DUF1189 domain-containing protein [Bacillus weihaiensis]|uniref:DUF1189 domain-containing protein n=1 Tax=Bacillus weihaiensis TaxID=1547283 RepID=A0A1L3MXA8_9BACI|nr:DUF1189 domain-containing protein [Bacillus weihaiensis]APH06981.1 hypothetical protein A9C19_06195 [Bacillus weihaiensis]
MNVFKQLITSIYSPKKISRFRFQGIGKTILFVFLLSLVSTIPTAYHFSSSLIQGINSFKVTLDNELPDFKISNGELTVDSDGPVEIRSGEFIIILDDTGSFGVEEIEAKTNAIGLLENQFVIAAEGQVQSTEYSMLNMTITKEELVDLTDQMDNLLPLIISILVLVMYLFGAFIKFIEITVLALFGLGIKNSLQKKINFKQTWIISAYSTTLATIFFVIMDSLQTVVPSGFLITWFVHIIVLYLAIKEIPTTKNKQS